MALKLKWKNRNVIPTTIRIYRSPTEIDTLALPEPVAVLENGEDSWEDANAAFGETYFYLFGTSNEHDTVFTPNQKIKVSDNRGAGPVDLLFGDESIGYYGTVPAADFFNSSHVLAAAKTTGGLPTALVSPVWHKMVRKGKIIYVPDQPFGTTTWNYLYLAGLVFGIDKNFPDGYNVTPATNQMRPMELNGEKYIPRLMRGWDDNNSLLTGTPSAGNADNYPELDCEYNDLMYPLFFRVPLEQKTENFAGASWDSIVGVPGANWSSSGNVTSMQNTSRILCQELYNGVSTPLTRGVRAVNYGPSPTGIHTRDYISDIRNQNASTSSNWIPVIEFVDEVEVTI